MIQKRKGISIKGTCILEAKKKKGSLVPLSSLLIIAAKGSFYKETAFVPKVFISLFVFISLRRNHCVLSERGALLACIKLMRVQAHDG